MRLSIVMHAVLVAGLIGCGARNAPPTILTPERSAVSVDLAQPQDLTITLAHGRAHQLAQAQKVLGQVRHHDADSLVLAVSAVYTTEGWERFTDATLRFSPAPTDGVTVLSTRPAATNFFGAVALPGLVALVVLFLMRFST